MESAYALPLRHPCARSLPLGLWMPRCAQSLMGIPSGAWRPMGSWAMVLPSIAWNQAHAFRYSSGTKASARDSVSSLSGLSYSYATLVYIGNPSMRLP